MDINSIITALLPVIALIAFVLIFKDRIISGILSSVNEKLNADKNEIRADMGARRDEILNLVNKIEGDLNNARAQVEQNQRVTITSFTQVKTALDEYKGITKELQVSTDSLRSLLSNNKTRGLFGERIAEDLMKMAGFAAGVDYLYNQSQGLTDAGRTRPDFSILLPDGMRINVDVKFPFSNFIKMVEMDDTESRSEYNKAFERDIKEKIKQVTSREYINSDGGTVDFIILFIPNEMIFSYIYEKFPEICSDAMAQKVILAGPFSFTAILRMVRQAHKNFRIERDLQQIVNYVKKFDDEFDKFYDEFQKLGEKLRATDKTYEAIATTRVNQLKRASERIQLMDGSDGETPSLPGSAIDRSAE